MQLLVSLFFTDPVTREPLIAPVKSYSERLRIITAPDIHIIVTPREYSKPFASQCHQNQINHFGESQVTRTSTE